MRVSPPLSNNAAACTTYVCRRVSRRPTPGISASILSGGDDRVPPPDEKGAN